MLLEAGARWVLGPGSPILTEILGQDERSHRIRWINKQHLSSSGWNVAYQMRHHPLLGWMPKANLQFEYSEGLLTTNSKGQRGSSEFTYARMINHQRILLLGDSFTYGNGVNDKEIYPYHLSQLLPGTEIINLGVSAYGHDQMLLYLLEEGIRYQPDIVILGYVDIDRSRNLLDFSSYAKPKAVPGAGGLQWVNQPVPSPDELRMSDVKRSRLLDLVRIFQARLQTLTGQRHELSEKVASTLLDEMHNTVERMGARFIIVYLPAFGDLNFALTGATPGEKFFFSYCANKSIACFSTRPDFQKAADNGHTFNTREHWSKIGHRIVADSISRFLLSSDKEQ